MSLLRTILRRRSVCGRLDCWNVSRYPDFIQSLFFKIRKFQVQTIINRRGNDGTFPPYKLWMQDERHKWEHKGTN
ncbi:unnamed protein product [Allacma fusca]|uniref:Uncharacterized protein n=1 Tax=Allacma fusca TaxID=39272 RepID=A0A8J2PTV2_9HEXA|nr:unnamed protein product [Allacma fusca]